jgi:ATP-binding cassette, subfamily F, member 3
MSLVTAHALAKSFGAQDVFSGVSLAIPHQARIALVGPNGIGKTTLLRILAGGERPDGGQVQRARALRIGYLPQVADDDPLAGAPPDETLWGFCLTSLASLRSQEVELARLESDMADPRRAEEALARYGPLQEAFERAGGYAYASRMRRVLNGMGFTPEEDSRPLGLLSGGERTRAQFSRLLLDDPDLLLLDEPTNHLDLEAVEWLEGWLKDWPGATLLVSHDRYFLDRAVDAVWELGPRGLDVYRGNYTAYLQQRQARRELRLSQYGQQQERVRRETDYIRRNIAGQNTRQAQGRRKRLERMLRDHPAERPEDAQTIRVRFADSDRSGDLVLRTRDLSIGHADAIEALFHVPDLTLRRGECAAVMGPNGAGKTTLLRTLLNEIPPKSGEVRFGATLLPGYFSQAHEGLHAERSVLQEMLAADPRLLPAEARHRLALFLFTGDTVDKTVAVLSGGERGRLALALLAQRGANLLLLDEPTTHLDLASQEILQASLAEFPGTILLVSHDRYLIDALATQIWTVSPQERALEVFEGSYTEHLEAQRQSALPRADARQVRPARSPRPSTRLRREIDQAEARIASLEHDLQATVLALESSGSDVESVRRLGGRYAELETALAQELHAWEELARQADEDHML